MRIVYGPINSLGLGKTIAVDPISRHPKVCNFNCIYCRLGERGIILLERSVFIDDDLIMEQLGECLHREECQTVMFKGTGEPLLSSNIFSMARRLKQAAPKKVALMTNCSLLSDPGVLDELDAFDILIAKLDAATEETFQMVNRPHSSIRYREVLENIREARRRFHGSFRMQVTMVKENIREMDNIAQLCREICPDYVYLNNPELCDPSHQVSKREAQAVWDKFSGIRCLCAREKE